MDDSINFYEDSDIAVEKWGQGFAIDSAMGTMRVKTVGEVVGIILGLSGLKQVFLTPELLYYSTDPKDPGQKRALTVGFKKIDPTVFRSGLAGSSYLSMPEVQKAYERATRARQEFLKREPLE